MKKKKLMITIIVLLIILGIGGLIAYRYIGGDFTQIGQQLKSADGTYTVSVPMRWEKTDPASQYGLIAAESRDKNMFMQVALDTDSDTKGSMEDYINNYIQSIAQKSDDSEKQVIVVSPEKKKVNGKNGYYFELESVSGGVNVHIWSFCCSTESGYLHIDVTGPKNETDNEKDIAASIIESLEQK